MFHNSSIVSVLAIFLCTLSITFSQPLSTSFFPLNHLATPLLSSKSFLPAILPLKSSKMSTFFLRSLNFSLQFLVFLFENIICFATQKISYHLYKGVIARICSSFVCFFCYYCVFRGGSRTAATYKMERFVIIVNGWKPLTIITKRSILDVAAVLDPPLVLVTDFLKLRISIFRFCLLLFLILCCLILLFDYVCLSMNKKDFLYFSWYKCM